MANTRFFLIEKKKNYSVFQMQQILGNQDNFLIKCQESTSDITAFSLEDPIIPVSLWLPEEAALSLGAAWSPLCHKCLLA